MDEEQRKQRYRSLLYSVNYLSNEIRKLNTELNNLNTYLEENFKIDDNFVEEDELLDITNITNSISNELKYTVIPNIRYKSN